MESVTRYILKVLKIKSAFFEWALKVFVIFNKLFVKIIQNKASIKSLTNCEKVPVTPLQWACSGFQYPSVTLIKVVPKAACDPENCSESLLWMYIKENQPMREKESRYRNFVRLSEQFSELVSKKQAKTYIYVYLEQEG
jgi:hypothetical protein